MAWIPKWAIGGSSSIIKPIEYTTYLPEETKFEGYKREFDLASPTVSSSVASKKEETPVAEIPQPLKKSNTSDTNNNIDSAAITSTLSGNYAEIDKALQKAGYSKNKRAAILATVEAESSGNPNAVGDNGLAVGLFQWHPDRQKFTGRDLASQTDWMIKELGTVGGGWLKQSALEDWNNNDDLEGLVRNLTFNFIRPADKEVQSKKRYALAQKYLRQLS